MRTKTPSLVITFSATTDAMAMESYCQSHELPGRLIPIPREIHAGCGLAWKTTPGMEDTFTAALEQAGIRAETMTVLELWG